MVEKKDSKQTSANEKEGKPAASMVPLLSRRSLIVLAVGLIIGAALGLGYWAIDPVVDFQAGWPPVRASNSQPVYESTVDIEIVHKGSTYTSVKTIQRVGEYWAAQMNTTPFLEFLSQWLAEHAPQYARTPEELDRIMRARYCLLYTSPSPRD